jgi:hypothetical protein
MVSTRLWTQKVWPPRNSSRRTDATAISSSNEPT